MPWFKARRISPPRGWWLDCPRLSTCNRLEVYASVDRFHAALAAVGDLLAEVTGVRLDDLTVTNEQEEV